MMAGILCVAAGLAGAQENSPQSVRNAVREYRQQHEVEIVRSYAQLLSLPNVATDLAIIKLNAEAISRLLELRAR
jgi:hypothetical protein